MKTCLECNDSIVGREDKKFCGDGCRNSYNNRQNKDSTNLMRNINNKLRKNYRILSQLNQEQNSKISRIKLVSKGFDFEFFTSLSTNSKGDASYFLYDQGYRLLEDDWFVLIKKET